MKRAIIITDGVVSDVFSAHFIKNNTDWLTDGVPDNVKLIEDDDDFRVGDHLTSDGKPDVFLREKDAKLAEIAAARYAAEVGGCEAGGMRILTDRESQAMITGAALQATLDPSYACRWKTPQGFVTLDARTVIGAASAVRAHVQACFDKEAELIERIEAAETAEEVAAIVW